MSARSRSLSRGRKPREVDVEEVVLDDDNTDEQQVEEVQAATRGSGRGRGRRAASASDGGWLRLRVIHVLLLVISGATGVQLWAHHAKFHVFNAWHAALTLFLVINAFICWCEICLHHFPAHIAKTHATLAKRHLGDEAAAAARWFLLPLTLDNCVFHAWAEMWATYAVFDASYADDRSYSFWVDSGNGLFTLVPTLLLLCGMTNDLSPVGLTPFWLGLLSFVTFWTEFYGTVLYFWSFFYHGRHRRNTLLNNLRFVVLTNGAWFVMPAIGMYFSTRMMRENSLAFLQT